MAIASGAKLGCDVDRNDEIAPAIAKHKVTGHDPNHMKVCSVEENRTIGDIGRPGIAALPQSVTDNDDVSIIPIFCLGECVPDDWAHSKNGKEIRSGRKTRELFGRPVPGDGPSAAARSSHIDEGMILIAPIEEIRGGRSVMYKPYTARVLEDHDDAFWIRIRKRAKNNGTKRGEYRSIGADAESKERKSQWR